MDLFFRGFWVPQGLQRCWAPCRVTRLDVESVKTAQNCQKKAQFLFLKTKENLNFLRASRHPQPRVQFSKSRPGVGRPKVNQVARACNVLVADWRKSGFKFEFIIRQNEQPKAVKRLVKYENLDRNE